MTRTDKNAQILILGGGVTGVIAARTLAEQGIDDYLIVEARPELGGRMMSHSFGRSNQTIEVGANWVQGTQTSNGPENPIWTLAKKHKVDTRFTGYDSMTTYDYTGKVDFLSLFKQSVGNYTSLIEGAGSRVPRQLVDTTSRTGYSLQGSKPKTPHELASEYCQFDWEYADSPEHTSWIASSWAHNFTFDPDAGGFSEDNYLSVDQRGFKTLIQQEAATFLQPSQILYNATVKEIAYSENGVEVTLVNGTVLTADYALYTFSLGVLQNDDVTFQPKLPEWKQEAIQSMTMATYTKIFLQFPKKFWFDTQFAVYADRIRGHYPVWQGLDLEDFFPDSGILFATVTGDYSVRVEALPDKQIQSEVMTVLRSMFPNITIPEPEAFFFKRWHADPLFRGSYSNWPASFFSEHHDNIRANVNERLWFAGEATSRKYFGFLHGAYFEGLDIATRIAKCIKGGGCVSLMHYEDVRNARPYRLD
ncbi:hypothetical protein QCA50_004752 [Cerrena zonata]|uniref:Amine oxidase domain-containing protein n=1 Tax=Cerrena zonata TaxID=2478898 RepID=A0AAW0GDA6_9APHY